MGTAHTARVPPEIPAARFRRGYGTYEVGLDRLGESAYVDVLTTALDLGYRHLDTAKQYDTETLVAAAIDRSDVTRETTFIATKLHWDDLGHDDAIEAAHGSRDRLGVDSIDLLYVHVPVRTYDPDETLPALDHLVETGVVDRIGLSNFLPGMLERAIDRLDHPVFAHQVEMHPLLDQARLHALAVDHGHWLVAFSPHMRGLIGEIAEVREVADRHGCSPHAVSLAWLLDRPNVAVLSHSTTRSHMRANLRGDLPDLTDADRRVIDGIDREHRVYDGRLDPWNQPIADEEPE